MDEQGSGMNVQNHLTIEPGILSRALAVIVTSFCVLIHQNAAEANEEMLWSALRSGDHIALIRHTIAPGTGDPDNFKIDDCSTQRNLSAEGRAQAARIGERFRKNGITKAHVYSSQWCRCQDTAEFLQLGPVKTLKELNSFYQRYENEERQSEGLKAWLSQMNLRELHILVTHQVNITALTAYYPSSGELVIARVGKNGALKMVGSIKTE
ncbi:MAG: histidine phosphatase family protein [Rhodospirillales bacterium]|nr:histidine phosphatase family protein [Rhodospirillales bacterium]